LGGHIRKRGVLVEIPRGSVGWSERELSRRWKWSRGKFRRFLKELEKSERIVPQKNNVTTRIDLVNYDVYQLGSTTNSTTNSTTDGPQTDHRQYLNKKEEKVKKEEKKTNGVHVAEKIIADLNARVGGKFRPKTAATVKAIHARIEEGATVEDFLLVHEYKTAEWLSDTKFSAYLTPSTLYRPSNFEGYLTAAQRWAEAGRPNPKAKPDDGWGRNPNLITGPVQYVDREPEW
jgi:uncharacterized phage protein (TIGR02220 family)